MISFFLSFFTFDKCRSSGYPVATVWHDLCNRGDEDAASVSWWAGISCYTDVTHQCRGNRMQVSGSGDYDCHAVVLCGDIYMGHITVEDVTNAIHKLKKGDREIL